MRIRNRRRVLYFAGSIILLLSFSLNAVLIQRYELLTKIQYKITGLFEAAPETFSEPYDESDNRPVVFHLTGNVIVEVDSADLDGGDPLPEDLIIKRGHYRFSGKEYLLTDEGLYRFVLPGRINLQRIVYDDDVDALLSAISWIGTHGYSDDEKSHQELSNKALNSKLLISCGPISNWGHFLMNDQDITTRIVGTLTLDEWNTYDNGHTLLEVWRDRWSKWVLYDLDNNAYFTSREDNVPLSLVEFSDLVTKDGYEIIYLSSDTRVDVSDLSATSGYNYSFISETVQANIRDWYKRVIQVPLIYSESESIFYFTDTLNEQIIESYSESYIGLDEIEFNKRFYPGD